MNRLVDLLAPKGKIDFLFKGVVLLLAISVLNWARDVFVSRDTPNGFLIDLRDATIVGLPFVALSLALIGHLARLQRKLLHLATTDVLTGLPNRRAFLDRITHDDGLRESGSFLMIDLDHFKRINDSYGHHIGDLCLRAAADLIRDGAAGQGDCARLGGEEFGLFLPEGTSDAGAIAQRLAAGLVVNRSGAESVTLTMSVGVMTAIGGRPVADVMSRADKALYLAKAKGRARAEVWADGADEFVQMPAA